MMQPCRVVKFGGSHFASDDYATRLAAWLRQQTPMHCVIVTGGGVWADAVRRLDQQHGISTTVAHWMAIRAMSLSSWLLVAETEQLQYIDRFETLRQRLARQQPAHFVFDVLQFLRCVEPDLRGVPLPHGWHVTSDSIAARLAQVLDAWELVLLKPKSASSPREAVRDGVVDDYFERASAGISRIRIDSIPASLERYPSSHVSTATD